MKKTNASGMSRRDFVKRSGMATLGGMAGLGLTGTAHASGDGRYNILFILTDQERHFAEHELPSGYELPGHRKLTSNGIVFENHQIASCVCTPSRSVIYTGQHIQNNGMFDNTNFPWSGSLSPDIDTLGDMLRRQGYYTAYKGKWHLTEEFETANDLHNPTRLLGKEMEEYGFSDYFGIGDVVAHTEGGFLHDGVIASMTKSWLRGRGQSLNAENKPWFMAVNLINPHDVMYYNTDLPGDKKQQAATAMMRLNWEPGGKQFAKQWDVVLPSTRSQAVSSPGRPRAHEDFVDSRAGLVGRVPNQDERWRRLNNYYLNCIQSVDGHVLAILNELDDLGLSDNTIVVYTADHGELAGAHGMSGKGATAFREQNNVPFVISHPEFPGNQRCRAVTSHVDIAPTLISMAGGEVSSLDKLPGEDISTVFSNPDKATLDAVRPGALYNYNMLAYLDSDFIQNVSQFVRGGGNPAELGKQGFRPDLAKRGAIRSVHDGQYKFTRYFSPQQHHTPRTLEELYANNDLELFDLKSDPAESNNLTADRSANGDLLLALNEKLNQQIEREVGEDSGQMLPERDGASWALDSDISQLRM